MKCRRLLRYPSDVVHILLEIAMIAMYIASYGSSYGHRDVWPIKAQRPYSVLTEITAIQLKNPEDRHSQIRKVEFDRLPQLKDIFAQSFHHSSNIKKNGFFGTLSQSRWGPKVPNFLVKITIQLFLLIFRTLS